MVDSAFVYQIGPLHWVMRYSYLQFRKRILRRDSRISLPTGLQMILPRHSRSATEVYVTSANIDWGAEAVLTQFAVRARDFIDVGAHVGYYSMYLSPRVRHVYAFEPDQRNISALRKNASWAGNIDVIEAAVSSHDGVGNLSIDQDPSVSRLDNVDGPQTIKVPIISIDSFVAAHPRINVGLIKTDIEGHDLKALQGMTTTVARHQPLILTECGDSVELSNLCEEWHYRIFAFVRDRSSLRTRFQEMLLEDMKQKWFKMLFLVPSHLRTAFTQLTRK
jgi:FkbM family methyltransferase